MRQRGGRCAERKSPWAGPWKMYTKVRGEGRGQDTESTADGSGAMAGPLQVVLILRGGRFRSAKSPPHDGITYATHKRCPSATAADALNRRCQRAAVRSRLRSRADVLRNPPATAARRCRRLCERDLSVVRLGLVMRPATGCCAQCGVIAPADSGLGKAATTCGADSGGCGRRTDCHG